ncbi:hypothetical protein EOA13_00380 [Mesorhizobium sp. M7A.F.Ca.US.011.01.1.1]|uniref:hypothetical protein n=1 Tax=Mesorhizobium sp. M7A.F.Ca.US.011.01.1.1 TaxID=2496741 RepID=UPI000FCB0B4E|nr:hypothetical protein [Mesorhizobium sp. M7A.F.Ca.US.011.01.1.1]RUX32600.1 hypothetical protein EOA13_00380 [Mesorhizobium sp. M7A.F.Ca.US.011.01.1.1]
MGDAATKKTKVVHGKDLTAYGVFRFAQTYRISADALAKIGPQMSDHPRRLLYFQALENYLRCFQLLGGTTPEDVRDYNHHFADRLTACKALGLQLPKEVQDFIQSPKRSKEYVKIRYDYRLDSQAAPWQAERTMKRLRAVVAEVEKAVDLAVQASNPEFIMLGDIKLTKISASGPENVPVRSSTDV